MNDDELRERFQQALIEKLGEQVRVSDWEGYVRDDENDDWVFPVYVTAEDDSWLFDAVCDLRSPRVTFEQQVDFVVVQMRKG